MYINKDHRGFEGQKDMKKGKLSNAPAPSVYIDGASLFLRGKFGYSPNMRYVNKLSRLMKFVNVVIFIERRGMLTKRAVEKSPFAFTSILESSPEHLVRFLRKNKMCIFASQDRAESRFSGYAYLLDANVENILAEVGG